jgi:hypothetical protein
LTIGLKTSFEDSGGGEGLIEGLGVGEGVGTELEAFGVGTVAVGGGDAGLFGCF